MTLPGETLATGASIVCDCGHKMKLQVCHSGAGYYIGTICPNDGPYTRESIYYPTSEEAQARLVNKTWMPRP